MIVGNGDIASILNDREGALFFASGVSDSSCTNDDEFLREQLTLLDQDKRTKCIFYFSTISVYYKDSDYTRHKLEMEHLIRTEFSNYCIIRLGNITWGKNPNTFLNYIRERKHKGLPFEIRDEWKYMIDKEQLLLITDNIPLVGRHEINIFGRMAKVKDLI